MKLTVILATTAAAAAALLVAGPGVAAPSGVAASATGAGQLNLAGGFRNFSFTARKYSDGSVKGQAQFNNRELGLRDHIAIDCLVTSGTHAWISGPVTSSNNPGNVGLVGVVYLEDNGEGAGAPPDRISLFTSFFPQSFSTCTGSFAQAYTQGAATPIDGGNIQIH